MYMPPTTARRSPTCTRLLPAGTTGESDKDVTTEKDSFKIEFVVEVTDLEKVGAGGISDIWAWLAPAGKSPVTTTTATRSCLT